MHHFIFRRHKVILSCAVALSVVSVFLLFRLKLDVSLFSLLPAERPEVKRFFQVTEEIGFQSMLITIVEADVAADIDDDRLIDLVESLAHAYAQNPMIEAVDYKSDQESLSDLLHSVLPYTPQLLGPEAMEDLARTLSNEQIIQRVADNRRLLMTPFGLAGRELIFQDPLGIGQLLAAGLTLPGAAIGRSMPGGYYRTQDRRTYFLFLKPSQPPQDIGFSRQLMRELNRMERAVYEEYAQAFGPLGSRIKFHHTGGHPIAVTDEALTKFDIKVTLLTSLAGVLLLFFLAFRTLKILLLVSIPLFLSLLWTVGFAGLVFQELNILTCIFSCVLVGLGIDFAIHMINRFYDPAAAGLGVLQRLEVVFEEAGTGILIGGVTTSAAFYAVGVSDFKGFRELGVMTGTGILFCLLAMMIVLPALMVAPLFQQNNRRPVTITGFGLKRLMQPVRRYPLRILVSCAAVIVVLITAGTNVRFDDNLKNFRPRDYQVLDLQNRVTQWLGGSMGVVLLTVTDPSEEKAMSITARIFKSMQRLQREGTVAGVSSISQVIPSPAEQRKSLDDVKRNPEAFDIHRIRQTFQAAMASAGFRSSPRTDLYFEQLAKALANDSLLLPSAIDDSRLDRLLRRYYYRSGQGFTAVTYINPSADLWSYEDTRRFKDTIVQTLAQEGIDASVYHLTGANLLTGELKRLIIDNLKSSMALAVLGILGILLIYFRSLKFFLLTILPLAVGMATLSGVMAAFKIDFNFLNLMVLPMIIGIGIDDGVHFANTFRQTRAKDLSQGLFQTGRAVLLTSLTTMVGFGSIALSHYPGLKSMGYVALIGIVACLLASIVVLPAVFSIIERRRDA